MVLLDPRAVALCPSTNHLWVIESAHRYGVERLRCIDTGVDVPLRAWEETIAEVEFSNDTAPLRVFYRVRAKDGTLRTEERRTSRPRRVRQALALPSELGGRASNRPGSDGSRAVLARLRAGVARWFGRAPSTDWRSIGAAVDARAGRDGADSPSGSGDDVRSRMDEAILRDEAGYFARVGDAVCLFDARTHEALGQWRNAESIAMNASVIALERDGHVTVLSRASLRPTADHPDFAAANALFVTDDGAVVAQDASGRTRWWGADGAPLCEHTTTDLLLGLARGGVDAVFFAREDSVDGPALRAMEVAGSLASESRCQRLPADARAVPCFSDDLRDIIVERGCVPDSQYWTEDGASEQVYWIRDGAVVTCSVVARAGFHPDAIPPRRGVCSARCSGDVLTCVAYDGAFSLALADGALVSRWTRALAVRGTHIVADWGVFSQFNDESAVRAMLVKEGGKGAVVELSRRSRAPGTVARFAPVVAWPQLEHRTVGVRATEDDEAAVLVCVANDEVDAVHSLALSPRATWLAVALRSGKILRFERSDDALEA